MQVLLSKKYEELFLKYSNQRMLVCTLSKESFSSVELTTDEVCSCSLPRTTLFSSCIRVFTNILLNNYTKVTQIAGPSRKRKLKAISDVPSK